MAGAEASLVRAPTLLIVGGKDTVVIQMNRDAMALMKCKTELKIVPGATHLFEERGALAQVASFGHGLVYDSSRMMSRRLTNLRKKETICQK